MCSGLNLKFVEEISFKSVSEFTHDVKTRKWCKIRCISNVFFFLFFLLLLQRQLNLSNLVLLAVATAVRQELSRIVNGLAGHTPPPSPDAPALSRISRSRSFFCLVFSTFHIFDICCNPTTKPHETKLLFCG